MNNGGDNDIWYDNLSKDEKTSIYDYTVTAYMRINDYLRNKQDYEETSSYTKELKQKADIIQRSITQKPLKDNLIVYRYDNGGFAGINNISELKNLKKGAILETKGFLSTSVQRKASFGNIGYEIKLKKGSKAGQYIGGMSEFKSEKEFLIKNGAKMKILGTKMKDANYILELEYIE